MIPGLNDFMAPDMQRILAFVIPAFVALGVLTMNLSRGFSTVGIVSLVLLVLIALYFLPEFLKVF